MIINDDPIASGAMGAPVVTVSPTVNTRKNVPMNSVRYLRMEELRERADGTGTRQRPRFYPGPGRRGSGPRAALGATRMAHCRCWLSLRRLTSGERMVSGS